MWYKTVLSLPLSNSSYILSCNPVASTMGLKTSLDMGNIPEDSELYVLQVLLGQVLQESWYPGYLQDIQDLGKGKAWDAEQWLQ
jgi:hypothetical protein